MCFFGGKRETLLFGAHLFFLFIQNKPDMKSLHWHFVSGPGSLYHGGSKFYDDFCRCFGCESGI